MTTDKTLERVARSLADDLSDQVRGDASASVEFLDVHRMARAAYAEVLAALAEDGLKIVPREPTRDMLLAAHLKDDFADECWRAMWGAAPSPRL